MLNTGSQSTFRRQASKEPNQVDSKFFQSLRPSIADSDISNCLTNQLLLGVANKPRTAGQSRMLFSQADQRGSLRKLSRDLTTATDIQRLLESRNITVREVMTAAKLHSKNEDDPIKKRQTEGLARSTRSTSELRKSKKIIRGLTASAKPSLILSKEVRNNPFAKIDSVNMERVERNGLFGMINAGHIPKTVDLKRTFNEVRRPQTSMPTSLVKSPSNNATPKANTTAIDVPPPSNTFITVSIPRNDVLDSPPHSSSNSYRRTVVRISKGTEVDMGLHSLIERIKVTPDLKYLTMYNYHIQKDDNYWLFRRDCLNKNEWSQYLHFEEHIHRFSLKYKIRKLQFLPNLNGLRRIHEQHIIESLKDGQAIHKIINQLRSNSSQFEQHRMEQLKSVMLMIVAKWRFRKTLDQVKYINTIKSLYRIHRRYEQSKCQITRTLNFKYELFADNQRLLMEQTPEESDAKRKIVEIHINTIGLHRQERDSYYKYHERLNVQITRIFSAVRNPKVEVVYISPFCEMNQKIQEYYHRMLKIRTLPGSELPTVHFYYLENMSGQLGKRVNTDDNFFYGLRTERLHELRKLLKFKQAYIVPGEMTSTVVKLCYLLDIPCYGGTFTKPSLELLFNRQEIADEDALINTVFEFVRFRPLLRAESKEQQLYDKLRKQFHEKKQAYQLSTKLQKIHFASSGYDRSVVGCRALFKRLGLHVPLALDSFHRDNFYEELSRMMLEHKDKTLWIFKMDGDNCSRGLASLETDSIKVVNERRKKGMMTHQAVIEVAAILKLILKEKLRLAHPSLHTSEEYLNKFLERGGVVEAAIKDVSSPCIFGQIQPNGQFVVHGSYRKTEVGNYSNNLAVYPASELTQTQFKQCSAVASQLYNQGIFGFITIQMLSYVDSQSSKRQRVFQFVGLDCHLTGYSSVQFLINWLLDGSVRGNYLLNCNGNRRHVLYCPFIDNNGFKCQQVRGFFLKCQQQDIVYDPQAGEGTVLLPIGNSTTQMLSVLCFSQDERKLYRMMADCLSGLNSLGNKCTQFDKDDNTKNCDNYYILDALWKVREINRQFGPNG